jgi:predicted ATPase
VIRTVAIQGYRSLRELVLPLNSLSVITGANGSGKSSVYRSLRLLADVAQNHVVANLAREGGLPSTFWTGQSDTMGGPGPVLGTWVGTSLRGHGTRCTKERHKRPSYQEAPIGFWE